jgi:hypothetical protein
VRRVRPRSFASLVAASWNGFPRAVGFAPNETQTQKNKRRKKPVDCPKLSHFVLSIAFYKEIPGLYKLWTTFSIFKTVFQLTLDPVANNSS